MFKKFLILSIFLLYQTNVQSKSFDQKNFNQRYLSNYFSALVSFDNVNNERAIKYYNSAIKSLPEYPIALNNLASAQQKLLEYELAYETYQKVLVIDPKNKTAIKKSKELKKRNSYKPFKGTKDKGF